MKKKLAGVVLAGILLRAAMLAGAGEALGGWVRELSVDGQLVSATLNLALGSPEEAGPTPTPNPVAEPGNTVTLASQTTELLLVEVTPAPTPEPEPVPTPEVRAADLSASVKVHNSAGVELDFAALAAEGCGLKLQAGQPQVLIVHTHSSEAYTPADTDQYEASDSYRTEDKAYSVIRVGDVLAQTLERHGLTVLHDREIYDYPSYTGSYERSGASVERYLKEYPTIRVVIDLHRDALGSDGVVYKTKAQTDGRTSAQVMMLIGTGQNGLWHPYWQENLKLALYLQSAMEGRYPGVLRPIELVKERYNQQLSTGMMILEVGSNGNTLQEALTAAELFGEAAGPALAALME